MITVLGEEEPGIFSGQIANRPYSAVPLVTNEDRDDRDD